MFRVARAGVPLRVLAPQTWSPFDPIGRALRSQFRTMGAMHEVDEGVHVDRPKALSIPGMLKTLDGPLMARSVRRTFERVIADFKPSVVDAHFLYPAGYSARLLARRHGLPYTVTIRGSADEWLIGTSRERMLTETLRDAAHIICVSEALQRNVVKRLIGDATPSTVIGNGVSLEKFHAVDRAQARQQLGIALDAQVIVGVGGLVARKGFQRIIPLLPDLRRQFPRLLFLIVGGGATVQDMRATLEAQVRELGLNERVRFCGFQPPEALKTYYSAADVFALATEHEGWANVFLEAMACGLPVITTRVGGNAEVVTRDSLGTLVDFFDGEAFGKALAAALQRDWDRHAIRDYARANSWESRIATLLAVLNEVASRSGKP